MFNMIFNNFWPKIISLILAIATWFYVFDLVNIEPQKKETVEDVLSREEFIAKEIPVKPVYTGLTPAGYTMDFDKVMIEPPLISLVGPATLLNKVEDIKTDRIDLGEYTRPVVLWVKLRSDVRSLNLKGREVKVTLPITKQNDG